MKKILSKVLRGIGIKKNGIRADMSSDRISYADYVNSKNYSSETNYLIWVDTGSFKVNILKEAQISGT